MASIPQVISGVRAPCAQLHSAPAQRASLISTPLRAGRSACGCFGGAVCSRHGARQLALRPLAAASTEVAAPAPKVESISVKDDAEIRYLTERAGHVTKHFPSALGVDDFMQRLEVALWGYGFQNDNSIGEWVLPAASKCFARCSSWSVVGPGWLLPAARPET